MFYIFEFIDKYSSWRRIVYGRLGNALRHVIRFKKLPKIQRDANAVK